MSHATVLQFIQTIIREGKFGAAELSECTFENANVEDQFASSVVFAKVKLKQTDVQEVTLVVKMQQDNDFVRESMNTDAQFFNEAVMYEDIFPFIDHDDVLLSIFPRCYYARGSLGDKPAEDVVIMEDLRSSGYRLSEEKLFLDYPHCVLCLKQLGRFHALSYAAKQRDFKTFMEKVNLLKETYYEKDQRDETNKFWMPYIERSILALYEKPEYKGVLETFAGDMDDPFTFIRSLIVPEEPTAVLCHGDFCRNNIMYKYEDDKPVGAKLFDLATARYCSPVIDLSFFFFLNVPSDIRRHHWDDLLAAYHDGLSTAVPGTRVPSLEVIKLEMRRKAAYAFALCCFFIPTMMVEEKMELDTFSMLRQDEFEEMAKTRGGKEATDAVVAVLEDLILKQCVS